MKQKPLVFVISVSIALLFVLWGILDPHGLSDQNQLFHPAKIRGKAVHAAAVFAVKFIEDK